MEQVDPDTGVIIDHEDIADEGRIAADGGYVPGACNTLGEFFDSLEEGQFSADLYGEIRKLADKLQEHAQYNSGKAKGKVSITAEFVQEAALTKIKVSYKVTPPEAPRLTSIMWPTDDGRLSRRQPRQEQLFGIRDAAARTPGGFRDA